MPVTLAFLSARAIFGALLMFVALAAGAVATYFNLRLAKGPREKAFTSRVCVVSWLVVALMLACAYFLPSPYRFYSTALFLLVCPMLVYKWAHTHALIRMLEQQDVEED
jgi:drug/metabolite transporter (DMT)-like permease